MIDDRLADELERIGVEGRVSILAEFADSSRVASHQIAEIIGGARRNRPADDRNAGRYGKISSSLGEPLSTHRRAVPARTQPRVGDPDLNDPQILLLELPTACWSILRPTSTARTATGPSPRCPVDGPLTATTSVHRTDGL